MLFIRQISEDEMLIAVCCAPLLAGLFFKFGIPFAEARLCAYFGTDAIIFPYYLLIDLFLCILTPYMLSFVSALVLLTEYDENLTNYLSVTPLGKSGYIFSRLVLPALFSFFVSIPIMLLFTLSSWSLHVLILCCFLACLISITAALLVFSFSHNRVEGMALGKMSGLYMFGLFVPFFIQTPLQFLFAPLPSFWMARFLVHIDMPSLIFALVTGSCWIRVFYRSFTLKLR